MRIIGILPQIVVTEHIAVIRHQHNYCIVQYALLAQRSNHEPNLVVDIGALCIEPHPSKNRLGGIRGKRTVTQPMNLDTMSFGMPLPAVDIIEDHAFEEVERQTPPHALKVMDNNVTQAAQALNFARSTLYLKLTLYRLIVSN